MSQSVHHSQHNKTTKRLKVNEGHKAFTTVNTIRQQNGLRLMKVTKRSPQVNTNKTTKRLKVNEGHKAFTTVNTIRQQNG